MATSMKKKWNRSPDHVTDSDQNKDTDGNVFLVEERRLSKKPVANQASQKRIGKINTRINQMTSKQIDEELEKRQVSISGEIDIRRSRLKYQQYLECKYECNNPLKMIEQDFEYIAVVDFEATCEQGQRTNYKHEIIEFPIVLINVQEQTIIDQFQSYCRPVINPILSKFCTDLTGIEQHRVANAPLFAEVLRNVETWLNERNLLSSTNKRRLAFATDGPWDFANFLQEQCHLSSISFPQWANKWVNIRKEFARFYAVRRCGIEKMLGRLGLSFDGRRHSGLDDAINIARIAVELLKDGCVLSLNDGIPGSEALTEDKNESKNNEEDEDSIVFKN